METLTMYLIELASIFGNQTLFHIIAFCDVDCLPFVPFVEVQLSLDASTPFVGHDETSQLHYFEYRNIINFPS